MPINAVCPDCENRFQLQESLLGQSVRCPFCKTVFVVTANASKLTFEAVPQPAAPDPGTPTRPRADAPAANYRTGAVTDFVQVIDAASAKPVKAAPVVQKWSPDVAPPGPTETTWSPDMDLPGGRPSQAVVEPSAPEYPRESVPKPRKKHRGRLLAGLIVFTLCCVAGGGYFLKRYMAFAPERLYAAGKKEYEDTHYEQARRLFDKLANEHPDHPRAAEARFFGPLAGLRNAVSSVMNKTDPTPAIGQWDQFQGVIADPALAPFADKNRFGIDVWQTGTRLIEDTLAKGNEVFNRDDPTDSDVWLQQAARIEAMLERFRPDDASKPEAISRELTALRQKIDGSRARATVLKDIRGLLAEPDDDRLQQAKQVAMSKGLDADDGYLKLVGEAEQKIRTRAVYVAVNPPVPKAPAPDDGLTSLLFAPRLDRGPRFPVRGQPATFFALARGIFYALDEPDGKVLWAMRTGVDSQVSAVSVPASDTTPELAIVPTSLNGQAGLHARHLRTGRSEWYQPLPAPCAGEPVFVGTELYVPLADGQGTVLEIVAATGEIRGKIQLGRGIGGQPVIRPGTGQLFIPAEAASVYVFDVNRRGANSEHLDPALVGVIPTGHGPGALQGPLFFANPEPDNPGPRRLMAGVAAGLDRMALRACPFADVDGGAVEPAGPFVETTVPGWSRFPAYCDGEKIAIVTDRRELLLLGMGLDGNRDVTLFPLPTAAKEDTVTDESAGQLVMADEVNYWTLAGRELRSFTSGFANKDGAKLVPAGKGVRVGEPVRAAQTNARRDLMVIVAQEGGSFRATAVSAVDGSLVWQRELGMLAKGEPFRRGDDVVWLDQGGGLTKLDAKPLTQDRAPVWLVDADERWMVAAPAVGFRLLTGLLPGPDGTALVLLEATTGTKQFLLRVLNGGRVDEQLVPAPAGLAGEPVIVGRSLVLPADNGTLYRLSLDGGKVLEEGPTWRGNLLPASSACFLAAVAEDEFLATDGNRSLLRWHWATATKRFESRGRLTLKDKFRAKPFVLPGAPAKFVTADAAGSLALWSTDKLGTTPALKGWAAAGKDAPIPVNDQILAVIPLPGDTATFVVIGNRNAFALRADAEKPLWTTAGQFSNLGRESAGQILIADRTGVRRMTLATGELSPPLFRAVGPYAVGGGAVSLGDTRLLVPLADGTLLLAETVPPGKP